LFSLFTLFTLFRLFRLLYDACEKAAGAGEVSVLPGEAREIHHGRATVWVERQGLLKGACCG
jgi:hypothetical protein